MTIFQGRAELLRRFREGNQAALGEVYWAYVDKVAAIARHGCRVSATSAGGRLVIPPADISDLVQDIFLRAFVPATREAFDGLREYGPFLYSVARHAIIDWARKRGREPRTESLPPEVLAAVAEAPAASNDEDADPHELEIARRYLEGLEPELRAVHQTRYVQGLSQREGAVALGLTRQSLRTLEDKLRTGLRRAIKRGALAAN